LNLLFGNFSAKPAYTIVW